MPAACVGLRLPAPRRTMADDLGGVRNDPNLEVTGRPFRQDQATPLTCETKDDQRIVNDELVEAYNEPPWRRLLKGMSRL